MFFGVGYFIDNIMSEIVEVHEDPEIAQGAVDACNSLMSCICGHGHYAVVRLQVLPPEGWFAFGTHMVSPDKLEFTKERDLDGFPIGERPILTDAA